MSGFITRVLAINGSCRDNGFTDRIVGTTTQAIVAAGGEIDIVQRREYPIAFCPNYRECMQQSGNTPGKCVHSDGMGAPVEKIEAADPCLLASPLGFDSVAGVFKRLMERLVVYACCPWGMAMPRFRKAAA